MNQDRGSFGRAYPPLKARLQRAATDAHILIYRLTGGRVGGVSFGLPMLLLTSRGRRSGLLRTAPLLYLPVDGRFVIVASNGGAQTSPTWYFNLVSHPTALVQIGPERATVTARRADDDERTRYWPLLLAIYPTYDEYQRRTDRQIPLMVLTPEDGRLDAHVPRRYRGSDGHSSTAE